MFASYRPLFFGGAKNPDGTQKTGGLQRRIRFIKLRGRERISFGNVRLAVSDDAIDPAVRDFDLQRVRAWFQSAGRVHTIWHLPRNAQRLTVYGDFGQVFHAAQVDPEVSTGLEPVVGSLNG